MGDDPAEVGIVDAGEVAEKGDAVVGDESEDTALSPALNISK